MGQTYKVRQIASTLLNLPRDPDHTVDDAATTGPQPMSTAEAEDYLRTFLDILVRLERVGVTGVSSMMMMDTDHSDPSSSRHASPEDTQGRATSYDSNEE